MTTMTKPAVDSFPAENVGKRLNSLLQQCAEETALPGDWEPVLDSLSVVSVLITIDDLFPFAIPPEKVVRKGGYKSIDDGVRHITGQLRKLWSKHHGMELHA